MKNFHIRAARESQSPPREEGWREAPGWSVTRPVDRLRSSGGLEPDHPVRALRGHPSLQGGDWRIPTLFRSILLLVLFAVFAQAQSGVKTPGVQIPIKMLKPDAVIPLTAPAGALLFTTDQVLITIPVKDEIVRVE